MSVATITELDLLIQKATSESIPNGELDLPSALEISDVVRSRKISPKDCMRCLKKRIMSTTSNPNTQLSSWKLTDICIKNGGIPFIKEICSREFMDTIEHAILKSHNNSELEELVTKLFYELYVAFKNDSQLSYVARVYDKLQARGVQFPNYATDPANSMAMFDSRTPADWVDSDACMICSRRFTLINRRHHCRSCGGIFCQDHSSHRIVLSDLGIHEPVRVCDNCYEDYDLKKTSGGGKKKHHSKKKKKSADGDYNEEEQLRRVIELSLRESKGNIEPIVPVMQSKVEIPAKSHEDIEEDDPDLKAAIEASLKEAEEEKRRREAYSTPQQAQSNQRYLEVEKPQAAPNFDLTSTEEEDIHLFSSLVERMKTQSATEILEDNQLAQLYQKVLGTRPKLNNALNESVQKYNTLIDMNTKISDIMTIYDGLLEQQLNSINLSDRYSVPQGPSDPYSAYQEQPSPYPQAQIPNYQPQPVSQPAAPQAQQVPAPSTQSTQIPQQRMPSISQQASNSVPERHLDQIKNIDLSSPRNQQHELQLPSEPPYPLAEEEEHITESRRFSSSKESNKSNANTETVVQNTSRKLSNGTPYPMEDDEAEQIAQAENSIKNYTFPTVPARKIVHSDSAKTVQNDVPEGSQSEEKLLIEL